MLHFLHCLFLRILECIETTVVASGIDQIEVSAILFRVQHDCRRNVLEAAGLFHTLTILGDEGIFAILLRQPFEARFEVRRAEQLCEALASLALGRLDESLDVTGCEVDHYFAWIESQEWSDILHSKAAPARWINEDEWKSLMTSTTHEINDGVY